MDTSVDEPAGSADPGQLVVVRPSKSSRWVMIGAGGLLALAMLAVPAFMLLMADQQQRTMVLSTFAFVAVAVLTLLLTLNLGTKLVLSATHLVRKPLVGPVRAIAWNEVSKISRVKQRLVITSRLGEKIDIGNEFLKPEFWAALRQWLPTRWHGQLAGMPGFVEAPGRAPAEVVLQVLLALAVIAFNVGAKRIDWRGMDGRCFQESVLSLLGPTRSCLDRASAAHDGDWMRALLNHRADPERRDGRGDTPLHAAVRNSYPDGVAILLDAHADPLATNRQRVTALEFAARSHDYESLRLMVDAIKARGNRNDARTVLGIAADDKDPRFREMVAQELGALLPKIADPDVEKRYVELLKGAQQAEERRDHGLAIAKAEAAIALDPQVGIGYLISGYAYGQKGNWGRAKARLRKSVELLPGNPDPYARLADIYFMTGDYDLADTNATQALDLDPQNWTLLRDRAMYRSEAGRIQAALEDATRACAHQAEMACEVQKDLQEKLAEERSVTAQH